MTNVSKIREAHRIVKNAGGVLTREQIDFLRSMLPPLPKQKTLEEITVHVYDAWIAASDDKFSGNEDDPDISLEDWLAELHTQLQGLKNNAEPAHPEFLETEADYRNAPEGEPVPLVREYGNGGWEEDLGEPYHWPIRSAACNEYCSPFDAAPAEFSRWVSDWEPVKAEPRRVNGMANPHI